MIAKKITEVLNNVLEDEYGEPLVGKISHSGNSWSVQYKPQGSTTHHLEGYGKFPFERFPNIPVIDLTTSFSAAIKSINNSPLSPERGGDVQKYLNWYKENGANIIYPK